MCDIQRAMSGSAEERHRWRRRGKEYSSLQIDNASHRGDIRACAIHVRLTPPTGGLVALYKILYIFGTILRLQSINCVYIRILPYNISGELGVPCCTDLALYYIQVCTTRVPCCKISSAYAPQIIRPVVYQVRIGSLKQSHVPLPHGVLLFSFLYYYNITTTLHIIKLS